MTFSVQVDNIKCGGCANTIRKKMMDIDGVNAAEVDIDNGLVTIDGDETIRPVVVEALLKAGYPESGSAEGMAALKAKASSFVSCAIGRMDS